MTRKTRVSLIAIWMASSFGTCYHPAERHPPALVAATQGMVSTAHPLASQAGLEVLAAGGNAFDAAVAVAATLNVVEPMNSGIGGYGTILIYSAAHDAVRFLNSSGRIPSGVDSDAFRAPTPGYEENRRGAKAVSTPGNATAWEALWKRYGSGEWAQLLQPAIRAARRGFAISEITARWIQDAYKEFPEPARSIYGSGGRPLPAGARLFQEDLAATLEALARDGAAAVHRGPLAHRIDAAMREAGGFLRYEDLAANEAEWWEPATISYRGVTVFTASPPATAFPSLIRLGLMSRYDVASLGHNSEMFLHRFGEVTKLAFWCRLAYAGDPAVAPPPLDKLLSESWWQESVARLDPERASPFVPPGSSGTEGENTTHFVVADSRGNIVSATQTLGNLFGSRIMPAGTGIWLNNSLAYCTFEPKGNPMDAHAGRRKLSGDCPTIILRDGRPWAAIGTPGGHTIGQTVPQMVMNLVDFRMNIAEAIAAPRIAFVEPDRLVVEEAVPQGVRDGLAARGHNIHTRRGIGNAHGLTITYGADGKPARFEGAADPRGEGVAAGPTGVRP